MPKTESPLHAALPSSAASAVPGGPTGGLEVGGGGSQTSAACGDQAQDPSVPTAHSSLPLPFLHPGLYLSPQKDLPAICSSHIWRPGQSSHACFRHACCFVSLCRQEGRDGLFEEAHCRHVTNMQLCAPLIVHSFTMVWTSTCRKSCLLCSCARMTFPKQHIGRPWLQAGVSAVFPASGDQLLLWMQLGRLMYCRALSPQAKARRERELSGAA